MRPNSRKLRAVAGRLTVTDTRSTGALPSCTAKAVEHLGTDYGPRVRLGGPYALKRLAQQAQGGDTGALIGAASVHLFQPGWLLYEWHVYELLLIPCTVNALPPIVKRLMQERNLAAHKWPGQPALNAVP